MIDRQDFDDDSNIVVPDANHANSPMDHEQEMANVLVQLWTSQCSMESHIAPGQWTLMEWAQWQKETDPRSSYE
ncbi:hypothetical protein AVEN_240087-1 [Araneus ventricosus]|uniref:Uncharacterized protein n=1 Tax=Araneus ventricosus TaxID=182803 RepID=A0A4Y2RNJ6_ARAVE|nr:hypothetical protein AVEN_240087-1 [Araneus ventricosus]